VTSWTRAVPRLRLPRRVPASSGLLERRSPVLCNILRECNSCHWFRRPTPLWVLPPSLGPNRLLSCLPVLLFIRLLLLFPAWLHPRPRFLATLVTSGMGHPRPKMLASLLSRRLGHPRPSFLERRLIFSRPATTVLRRIILRSSLLPPNGVSVVTSAFRSLSVSSSLTPVLPCCP
jgi:hypothetical protein